VVLLEKDVLEILKVGTTQPLLFCCALSILCIIINLNLECQLKTN